MDSKDWLTFVLIGFNIGYVVIYLIRKVLVNPKKKENEVVFLGKCPSPKTEFFRTLPFVIGEILFLLLVLYFKKEEWGIGIFNTILICVGIVGVILSPYAFRRRKPVRFSKHRFKYRNDWAENHNIPYTKIDHIRITDIGFDIKYNTSMWFSYKYEADFSEEEKAKFYNFLDNTNLKVNYEDSPKENIG